MGSFSRYLSSFALLLHTLPQLVVARPTVDILTPITPHSAHDQSIRHSAHSSLLLSRSTNCTHSSSDRACWSDGFDISTDSETSWPNTGKTVSYNLEITNTTMSPDGTPVMVFAVNGQYPGPTITADWGDTLSVTVKNSLQYNGTSVHWHGVSQMGTNNMDGVNGVTECPLAPGQSKTYTFLATQYGTTWYHSHFSSQYGDGVLGPIVINGPASQNYDVDLGVLPITDWYYTAAQQLDYRLAPTGNLPPVADNGLINGTMVGPSGSGGKYNVNTMQAGKTYRLRLVNTAVDNHFRVSLDGHLMTVVQADFVATEPYTTDWLFVAIGQRYDVLIHANQTVGNYWFRAQVQSLCGDNANSNNIKSIFSYEGAPSGNPNSSASNYTQSCDDLTPSLQSYVKKSVPQAGFSNKAGNLGVLLNYGTNATYAEELGDPDVVQWSINDSLMHINWTKPTLDYVKNGAQSTADFPSTYNLITLNQTNEFTFWIIQSVTGGNGTAPHPIHLHGHDFYVLGMQSESNFTSDLTSSLNFNSPPRRDVAMLPNNGWLVIAFETDNPGAWLMHCHIAWHVSEGLAVQFLERPADIPKTFDLGSSDFDDICQKWDEYSANAVYPQFESGLRKRQHTSPSTPLLGAVVSR